MNQTGRGSQTAPAALAPLTAAAVWPVRSGLVPPLADRFNSRPETAPDLGLAFARSATVALTAPAHRSGPGMLQDWLRCCGKTQLAVAFAESVWQARSIDLLVWIDASSSASILAGYADAAGAVAGRPVRGDAEHTAASFLAWLGQTNRRWLVVLDGLEDAAVLDGLRPFGPAGRILVTAATPEAATKLPDSLALEIGPFSPREAMSYLVARLSSDPDQRRGAIDLIDALACHPVALEHATATIGSSWITCVDYRERFHQRQALLTANGGQPPPAPAVTWTLAVDQADQLVPGGAAQFCLAVMALLDGHGFPVTLFGTSSVRGYLATGRASADSEGQHVSDAGPPQMALSTLERSGLISIDRSARPGIVRMSLTLQQAVRAAMPAQMQEQAARTAAIALLEIWPEFDSVSGTSQLLQASTTSLLAGAGAVLWADGCPAVLLRAGQSLDNAGMPRAAADYWRHVAEVCDQMLGPSHPDSLRLVEYLANACKLAGRPEEAIAWRQRVADDRARSLGPGHPAALAAQVSLGRSLAEAGDFGGAVAVLDAALAESDPRRGSGPATIAVREGLAAAYVAARQPDHAIRLLRAVLSERERSAGPLHRDTIAARQRLAEAYLSGGRLKEAISQYRRALAERERADGADHRATLRTRGALAAAYQQAGRIGNAVAMYEETRAGCERALGPDDPDTLSACVSLALIYQTLGHLGNATALLHDALGRCERVLSPGDPTTLLARESLAAIHGQ